MDRQYVSRAVVICFKRDENNEKRIIFCKKGGDARKKIIVDKSEILNVALVPVCHCLRSLEDRKLYVSE
jgi:hypothetical protein